MAFIRMLLGLSRIDPTLKEDFEEAARKFDQRVFLLLALNLKLGGPSLDE